MNDTTDPTEYEVQRRLDIELRAKAGDPDAIRQERMERTERAASQFYGDRDASTGVLRQKESNDDV